MTAHGTRTPIIELQQRTPARCPNDDSPGPFGPRLGNDPARGPFARLPAWAHTPRPPVPMPDLREVLTCRPPDPTSAPSCRCT